MPMSHLRFTLKCMPSIKNLVRNLIPEGEAGAPVFAVIDTETTGLNKRYDRIIELAAVRFDNQFREVDRWHTLLNPDGKKITNAKIHGITNGDVATAPRFAEIYTEFARFIHGQVLIAHNAPFDAKMLEAEVNRIDPNGKDSTDVFFAFVDSIDLAKQVLPQGPHNLPALLKHYGLKNQQAHAAIGDAAATGAMLRAMFGIKLPIISRKISKKAPTFDGSHAARWGLSCTAPQPRI